MKNDMADRGGSAPRTADPLAALDLLAALQKAQTYMIGLKAYLATCARDVILDNLETIIASLRNQIEQAEAALRKARGEK